MLLQKFKFCGLLEISTHSDGADKDEGDDFESPKLRFPSSLTTRLNWSNKEEAEWILAFEMNHSIQSWMQNLERS